MEWKVDLNYRGIRQWLLKGQLLLHLELCHLLRQEITHRIIH